MFLIFKHLFKVVSITFTCPHHVVKCLNMVGVQSSFTHSLKNKKKGREREGEGRKTRKKEERKEGREGGREGWSKEGKEGIKEGKE